MPHPDDAIGERVRVVAVRSTVAVTLPLDANPRRDAAGWARLMDTAKQRVPVQTPAKWRATAADVGDAFLLALTLDQTVSTTVNFFPLHESEVDDAARQVARRDGGRLELRLEKSAQLARNPRELVGVLTIGTGQRYVITAPVQARSPISKGRHNSPSNTTFNGALPFSVLRRQTSPLDSARR